MSVLRRNLNDHKRITQANIEEKFLRYLFSMLAKLAKADGRIDAEEVSTMEIVFDHFGFALQRREYCSKVFNEAKNYTKDIYWFAEQFSKVANDEVCIFVYELLWDVACADGWLHPLEYNILCRICPFLRVPSQCFNDNFRRRRGSFIEGDKWNAHQGARQNQDEARCWRRVYVSGKSTLAEAYEILECEQSAIMEELKTAYHRIAKRYHPVLLRANGVPEEMINEATERMAQVNAAWKDICRARSI